MGESSALTWRALSAAGYGRRAHRRQCLLFQFLPAEGRDHADGLEILLHHGHDVALLLAHFVGRTLDRFLEPGASRSSNGVIATAISVKSQLRKNITTNMPRM